MSTHGKVTGERASVTVTAADNGPHAGPAGEPQLFMLLEGERPLAGASRHLLAGLDLVTIGRGGPSAKRATETSRRSLALALPDRTMSGEHARIIRLRERWILEDAGSKNGTQVNGGPVRRAVLLDGDVIEVGRSFLLYRDAVPPLRPEAPDLAATDLDELLPGVTSFSASLADPAIALRRVAESTVPVILVGATGTGKEVLARALHAASGRAGPFVGVNCGAIPAALVEATLFGHRRGAFSGAVDDRPGHLRAADGGTILLDEIGELPAPAQVALLRVLQEREVTPVGDSRALRVDVRVVAAGLSDLDSIVAEGRFRADLAARLTGLVVRLPPLAERREDLGLLVPALLRRAGAGPRVTLSGAAARALLLHAWPRNVRELEQTLAAAVAQAAGGALGTNELPEVLRRLAEHVPEDRLKSELATLLGEHDGNLAAVARVLGKGRTQIRRWVRRFGLDPESFRRGPG